MYSAVKVDGQPLYRRARQGKVIDRPAREVTIFELDLYFWQSPEIQVRLVCSSGTYVRVIAHDLGRSLGCGAYLMGLHRTAVGNHRVDTAIPLADLQKSGCLVISPSVIYLAWFWQKKKPSLCTMASESLIIPSLLNRWFVPMTRMVVLSASLLVMSNIGQLKKSSTNLEGDQIKSRVYDQII